MRHLMPIVTPRLVLRRYELSRFGIDVVLVQPSSYPTGIFAGAQQPADTDRIAAYGELGGFPLR